MSLDPLEGAEAATKPAQEGAGQQPPLMLQTDALVGNATEARGHLVAGEHTMAGVNGRDSVSSPMGS